MLLRNLSIQIQKLKIVELDKSKAKVVVKEVNKKELEELVKDLSSNLKSKSSTKSAKISNDKSKKIQN